MTDHTQNHIKDLALIIVANRVDTTCGEFYQALMEMAKGVQRFYHHPLYEGTGDYVYEHLTLAQQRIDKFKSGEVQRFH